MNWYGTSHCRYLRIPLSVRTHFLLLFYLKNWPTKFLSYFSHLFVQFHCDKKTSSPRQGLYLTRLFFELCFLRTVLQLDLKSESIKQNKKNLKKTELIYSWVKSSHCSKYLQNSKFNTHGMQKILIILDDDWQTRKWKICISISRSKWIRFDYLAPLLSLFHGEGNATTDNRTLQSTTAKQTTQLSWDYNPKMNNFPIINDIF